MDKALEFVRTLADKLGQTVESLWPHAVRYVAVDALSLLIGKLVTLVFITVVSVVCYKQLDKMEKGYDSEGRQIGKVLTIIVYVIAGFCLIIAASSDVAAIIEPTGLLVTRFLSSH